MTRKLKENFSVAYKSYLKLEENEDDEEAEKILEECDDVYYDNEQEINIVLEQYCKENHI